MNPQNFFEEVIELYQNARKAKFKHSQIFRGRNSSISSDLEDLLALYLAKNSKDNYSYFVDQPIKVNDTKNNKYPDIILFEKEKIFHLIDVKSDIGWHRNTMFEFCEEWNQIIENWKLKDFSLKTGEEKKLISGNFDKNLKLHIVIISLKNSGKKILEDEKAINKKLKNIRLYILSDGIHPNAYIEKNEVLKKLEIKKDEFSMLLKNTRQKNI
jgi:hypothetical protein